MAVTAAPSQAKTNLPRGFREVVAGGPLRHTGASFRDKEGGAGGPTNHSIPRPGILGKGLSRGFVQRHQPRLAKLRPLNP